MVVNHMQNITDEAKRRLVELYNSNAAARAVLDLIAKRERNSRSTEIERISDLLEQAGYSFARREILDVLRSLSDIGLGAFKAGRRGYVTRLEWTTNMIEVGRLASGQSVDEATGQSAGEDGDEPDESPAEEVESDQLKHIFRLRPSYLVEIYLPADIRKSEADRLAAWIQTLPFDSTEVLRCSPPTVPETQHP
jgi:hypothetical protein